MSETCRIEVIGVVMYFLQTLYKQKPGFTQLNAVKLHQTLYDEKTWINTMKRGDTHLQSLNQSTNAVVRILNRTTNCLKLNTVTIFNLLEIFLIYTRTK